MYSWLDYVLSFCLMNIYLATIKHISKKLGVNDKIIFQLLLSPQEDVTKLDCGLCFNLLSWTHFSRYSAIF